MDKLGKEMSELLDEHVANSRAEALRGVDTHQSFNHAKWASLHAELNNNGTNNSKNLTDPFGDGDQNLIHIFKVNIGYFFSLDCVVVNSNY
jgi:hypothetical protein